LDDRLPGDLEVFADRRDRPSGWLANQSPAAAAELKKLLRLQISARTSSTAWSGRIFETTAAGGSTVTTWSGVMSTRTGWPMTGQTDSVTLGRPSMTGSSKVSLAQDA